MRSTLPCFVLLAACGGATTGSRGPLTAEVMQGPALGHAGRVLVMTATCGSLENECRNTWAPTVDQIILGGLEFRGYATINPESLRKDERQRDEKIEEHDERVESEHTDSGGGVGIIGILPFGGGGSSTSKGVTVSQSRHKTIILQGANYDDLRLEDKQALMQLANANSVVTTRVVVGANYGTWTQAQVVEVVVKLAAADSGTMRWSTRCLASSADYPNVESAIENAARCAASAFTLDQ